jgi:hypothetical protein
MQTSKNAFELFPADQFDAWVDGVRSKIIDGLERQHLPGGSQVRVPELSSKALEAIEAARRDEELTRQAIASSSSLADQMDVVKDTDAIVEVTEEVTTTTVVAEFEEAYNGGYGNAAGLEDPAENLGSEVDYDEEASETGYASEPIARPDLAFQQHVNAYPDDQEFYGEGQEAEDEEAEEEEGEDEIGDEHESSQDNEIEDDEDEFEIVDEDEEGSNRDMMDNERDELESNGDREESREPLADGGRSDDELDEAESRSVDGGSRSADDRLASFGELDEERSQTSAGDLMPRPECPFIEDDEDATAEREIDDIGDAADTRDEDVEAEESDAGGEDEIYSVQDSSDEEARFEADNESGPDEIREHREAGTRVSQLKDDQEDEEEDEVLELDEEDMSEKGSDQEGSMDDAGNDEGRSIEDEEEMQSRKYDRSVVHRLGLIIDHDDFLDLDRFLRARGSCSTRRIGYRYSSAGLTAYHRIRWYLPRYIRGRRDCPGRCQGRRKVCSRRRCVSHRFTSRILLLSHLASADDKDSQQDPEYSADERESIEDIQYADDDNGKPNVSRSSIRQEPDDVMTFNSRNFRSD